MKNPKLLFNFNRNYLSVYWFYNIDQEQRWNQSKVFISITDEQQLKLVRQQEQQMFFLADAKDQILLRHQPDKEYLDYLILNGISIPNFIKIEEKDEFKGEMLESNQEAIIVPYINTRQISQEALKEGKSLRVYGADEELVKNFNDKFFVREWSIKNGFLVTQGMFCNNIEELRKGYEVLKNLGFSKVVLKIPFGSSGKGIRIIKDYDEFIKTVSSISRRNKEFKLLLEGWHPIAQSLNSQILVNDDKVSVLAVTEQRIDENGVYQGTNYTPSYSASMYDKYYHEMLRLGELLKSEGYRGIVGVDSIIDTAGNMIPIIEINARFTQVTYILPVVCKLKESYKFIQSRFIRLESLEELGFNEIYEKLKNYYNCEEEQERLFVYTFAKTLLNNKTIYRIFVLFYGNDKDLVNSQCEKLKKFQNVL